MKAVIAELLLKMLPALLQYIESLLLNKHADKKEQVNAATLHICSRSIIQKHWVSIFRGEWQLSSLALC